MKLNYVKNSLIFTLTFLVSACFLKLLVPKESVPGSIYSYGAKFSHFTENKDEYDIIFVGTSRVHNQISPKVFDQYLLDAGHEYKSFNFGLQGARILTTYFMINEILETKPQNLKWIVVENLLDEGYAPLQNARTPREIHFHDLEDTLFSISYTLDSNNPPHKKAVLAFSHFPPFLFNFLNLGRIVDQLQLKSDEALREELGVHGDGHIASPQRKINREKYLDKVESLRTTPYIETALTSNRLKIVNEIIRTIEDYGVEPVFLVAPGVIRNDELISAYRQGHVDTLFVYNNPAKYPELYEIDSRSDDEHLNEYGSEIFSELVATDFIEYLNSRPSGK